MTSGMPRAARVMPPATSMGILARFSGRMPWSTGDREEVFVAMSPSRRRGGSLRARPCLGDSPNRVSALASPVADDAPGAAATAARQSTTVRNVLCRSGR